ncbi:hypothetical protein ABT247_32500 [Kitasatospora sp. NPDC001539]|uniref:hypothetical protein n=1 Tax=unclassified Kitasatospora TaxID=2633591 RepID=UPI00331D98E7
MTPATADEAAETASEARACAEASAELAPPAAEASADPAPPAAEASFEAAEAAALAAFCTSVAAEEAVPLALLPDEHPASTATPMTAAASAPAATAW